MTTRQKVSQAKKVTRYGQELIVEAQVGAPVELDSGRCELLLAGDDFTDSSWAGCDFRFPNPIREWATKHAIACNVKITGRTVQQRHGSDWVRVKLQWVGDGSPDTFTSGWLLVDSRVIQTEVF